MSDADDRKRIREQWMRLNREVRNPLPGSIPWDEPFGRLEDWRDADAGRLWNVDAIVAPTSRGDE